MKNEYKWYFAPEQKEIDEIWNRGILTVDANVLLDLYRYNESTRNRLIDSLKSFEGRLWLSRQAADEFIRNRTTVIVDSNKTFKEARDQISNLENNLESTVNQLKGNRIIPNEIPETLKDGILPKIENASKEIEECLSKHPNFLKEDPILNRIAELFNKSIGKPFEEEERKKLLEEANQREADNVPPGYLDEDKEGEKSYGDFFLWKEILQYSKNNSIPMIHVTSERKEDWWEKRSGQIIGPRYELLREAYEATGEQRILIYQTLNFLEYSTDRQGQKLDESTVEDITAVDKLRSEVAIEVLSQYTINASKTYQEGELHVELKRPVVNFTGSGHFEPKMDEVPNIKVSLLNHPDEVPKHKLSGGTGTKHDFNLHIKSLEHEQLLPTGIYKFHYMAKLDDEETNKNKKLFKVASELNVATHSIVDTLNENGFDVANQPNTKITPEMYRLVENKFH